MIITIDFDNTIAVDEFPKVGPWVPGALVGIESLWNEGHTLILWTCREGEPLMNAMKALMAAGASGYIKAVNEWDDESLEKWGTNPRKIVGDMNIDDRNVGVPLIDFMGRRCVDWVTVCNLVDLRDRGIM